MIVLRRIFPPDGPRYAIYDSAVFVALLGLIGYVFTAPPERIASAAPIQALSSSVWGYLLAAVGVFAAWCAYQSPKWVYRGVHAMIWTTFFWGMQFAYVLVFSETSLRTSISMLIYFWVCSAMIRARRAFQISEIANKLRVPNTYLCPPCREGDHIGCMGHALCDCKHKSRNLTSGW